MRYPGGMYHRSDAEVATIAIACSGSGQGSIRSGPGGRRRSKNGALLQLTSADARRFLATVPLVEDDIADTPDLPRAQLLIEPSIAEFLGAVHLASLYVERRKGDWSGGGLTVFYSGHGAPVTGALVLRDGEITAGELLHLLALKHPRHDGTELGVELMLDSCYSAAFLAEFIAESQDTLVSPRDSWAASLHNEIAWELDELGHGALSFSLLFPGNAHVDHDALAHAIHVGDEKYIRMALKSFVPNPVTYLTERDQHEVRLTSGHYLEVVGAGACELADAGRVTKDQILDVLERAVNARPNERLQIDSHGRPL